MIKIRLNAISSNEVIAEFKEGENLLQLIKRSLNENGLDSEDQNLLEHFCAIVDGKEIPRELWEFCNVEESANVLIAPVIKGGDFGQIFKQVALIAVTVLSYKLTAGLGPIAQGLITAGVSIGSSLALNALIPPPNPGGLNDFGGANDYAESQMFSISSQSNAVKKYGGVPKVYGTHRVFPNLAATPYTELETDPSTQKLVQYFYAIYDLGFGPLTVSDIKIGDTPLTLGQSPNETGNFADVDYNLVDLNRPTTSEGVWDDRLESDFQLYKGSVEVEELNIGLNVDQSPTKNIEDYQAIRNAAPNDGGYAQEISLNFILPQGLFAMASNGDRFKRTIELTIKYAKIGTEDWRNYNDPEYSSSWTSSGGDVFAQYQMTLPNWVHGQESTIAGYYSTVYTNRRFGSGISSTYVRHKYVFTIPAGATQITVLAGQISVGEYLGFNNELVGKVIAVAPHPALAGNQLVTLDKPLAKSYEAGSMEYVNYPYNSNFSDTEIVISRTLTMFRRLLTDGKCAISANDTTQVFATFKFKPKEIGSYKVKVVRVKTYSPASFQTADTLNLYGVTTRFNTAPILTDKRHVFLELKIRATNQINGGIQNLSAICSSVLDVYDSNSQSWSKQVTSNPAWVYADLLTGEINKRAIDKSRLDVNSLAEWSEFCDEIPTSFNPAEPYGEKRFTTNFVLDYSTTLKDALMSVANAAQASMNIVDGKYGVLIDKKRTVPVQVFTPRNSSGFSSSRVYSVNPHGLKVRFVEPLSNWQQSEIIVYADGYNETNATEFEEIDTFACTNQEQAFRFGRYMMAQNKLRQEQISINVDFEYLVCTRGDFVQITQDVMMAGGQPARVKSVSGNTITIDDGITTEVGTNYGYVYRNAVDGIKTNTLTPINSSTFQLDGDIPDVGDLIVIGEVDSIVLDCIVKSITPNDDLTAQLILVEKADAIYDAESNAPIPDYNPNIARTVIEGVTPPGEVQSLAVIDNSWIFTGAGYQHYIDLDWNVPITGGIYEAFEVYADFGKGYNLYSITREADIRYLVDSDNLGLNHDFKVLAVSASGAKLDLASIGFVSATPLPKTERPSDVDALYINITNEVLQLNWPAVSDIDVKEYLIRYTPDTVEGTWTASIPLLRTGNVNTTATAQARTGTYLIKALDWNGNESESSASAVTSIPNLFNLNIIEETSDFPALLGVTDRANILNGSLVIQNKVVGGVTSNEYHSEGFYYYKEFLDLGDVYSVRLQSLIRAEGYTVGDLMANWIPLSSVPFLSNSKFSEWDVETQVRATNSFNVMSEWGNLSSINPISEGNQDNFTAWRSFIMGDFTGRIFQFRLRLISNKPSVSPRVFDGIIRSDMPDRVDSYNNIISNAVGPTVITYSTPFKGPLPSPNVQITIDDSQSGDYYQVSNKSLAGFEIIFYDKNDAQVVRQFDAAIKGHGSRSLNTI